MYYANYWELVDESWIEELIIPNSLYRFIWWGLMINHFTLVAYFELYRVTLKFIDYFHQIAVVLFLYLLWNFGYLVELVSRIWTFEMITHLLITTPCLSLYANRHIKNYKYRWLIVLLNVLYFGYQQYFGTVVCLVLFQVANTWITHRFLKIGINLARKYLDRPNPALETILYWNYHALKHRYFPNFLELVKNYYQNDQSQQWTDQRRDRIRLLLNSFPNWQFLKTEKTFVIFTPVLVIILTQGKIQILREFKLIKSVSEEECPICRESFSIPVLELNCNHRFCGHCLCSWILNNKNCPLCRLKLR